MFEMNEIYYWIANMDDDDFRPNPKYKYYVQVVNGTEIPNDPIYFYEINEELYFNGMLIPKHILQKAANIAKGQGLYFDSKGNECLPF